MMHAVEDIVYKLGATMVHCRCGHVPICSTSHRSPAVDLQHMLLAGESNAAHCALPSAHDCAERPPVSCSTRLRRLESAESASAVPVARCRSVATCATQSAAGVTIGTPTPQQGHAQLVGNAVPWQMHKGTTGKSWKKFNTSY